MFVVTIIAHHLVEIGDRTQIATAVLAAKFDSLVAVVAGTTLGMLQVGAPAGVFWATPRRRCLPDWERGWLSRRISARSRPV